MIAERSEFLVETGDGPTPLPANLSIGVYNWPYMRAPPAVKQKGGFEYRRLVAAFERIFGATMFFGTEAGIGKARVVQRSRFNFLREARIWYAREPARMTISDEFENVIVLSDEFYSEIASHPVPTDLDAVRALTASPGLLDLFMWLSY